MELIGTEIGCPFLGGAKCAERLCAGWHEFYRPVVQNAEGAWVYADNGKPVPVRQDGKPQPEIIGACWMQVIATNARAQSAYIGEIWRIIREFVEAQEEKLENEGGEGHGDSE